VAELAISLAITAATTGLQSAFAPKPKKPDPIDRGKLDDPRFSIPALGAAIPKGWGTFRCAPIWIDHTPTDHRIEVTEGQQGGKGGGGTAPTADERKHIYTKSVIGVFHNGLIHKGVSKMWFGSRLAYNSNLATIEADTSATRNEAEHGVLAGGASVATQVECSGGRKVTGIGSGGSVTLTVNVPSTGSYEIACYYTSTADRTFKIRVNGGATNDLFCPSSGGAGEVTSEVITLTLTAGDNTLKFENSGAACPDLDRIDVAPVLVFTPEGDDPRGFTGIIRPGTFGPENPDYAWSMSNEAPLFSEAEGGVTNGGFYQAVLADFGNPTIRFYNGSELQEADPIIVALRGLDLAPGYRNLGIVAIENIQLQNGQMPNTTVEVQQGVRELTAIVTDIYNEVGVPADWLDLTALNGLMLGDSSGFDPGAYSTISWTGLSNATPGAGGAITKTSGTNNSWNAYANSGGTVGAGTNAAIRFVAGVATFMLGFGYTSTPGAALPHPYDQVPFAIILNKNSNPSQDAKNAIQLSIGGSNNTYDVGTWSPGDKLQVEYRNGRFTAYQNGLALTGYIPPVPSTFPLIPLYVGYATGGGPASASFASGSNVGTEPIVSNGGGLFMESPRPAGELIVELMTRFQFDLPEVDGVVKAVLRNSPSDLTIPYTDLRVHRGDQPPAEDMVITRVDPLTLPKVTTVTYSDPAYAFHTRTQSEPRLFGPQRGRHDVVLNMIETAQNMKNLAITISNRFEVEGQKYKFTLGPKYTHIHQGTVLTINSRSGTQHVVRAKEINDELPVGIMEVEAVRQDAAVFGVNGTPSVISLENPIVPIPGQTRGMFVDAFIVDPANSVTNPLAAVYVGMSGRGSGAWSGGFLYREFPSASGNYIRVAATDKPATTGVAVGTLGTTANFTTIDAVNSVVVDLYYGELESVTEAELLANPTLNLLYIGSEYVQFQTATPGTAVAPFVKRYTLTNFLRGRHETPTAAPLHATGEACALINGAMSIVPVDIIKLGVSEKYKFVTVGMGLDVAPETFFTWQGVNLKAQKPTSIAGVFDQASGGLLLDWVDQLNTPPSADDAFDFVVRSAANGGGTILRGPLPIKPNDLARTSNTPPLSALSTGGLLPIGAYTFFEPGGFDAVYTSDQWNTFGLAAFVESSSTFKIEGGFIFEAQVSGAFDVTTAPVNGLFPSFFGIKTEDLVDDPVQIGWTKAFSINPDVIQPLGASIDRVYHMVAGDRFTTQVQPDGTAMYYINYLGAMSDPWYVSPQKLDMTVMYRLQFHNVPYATGVGSSSYKVSVRNTRWMRGNTPEFSYTGDMQKADNGGSLPTIIHVGIRKKSAHPLGPPSDWLYESFERIGSVPEVGDLLTEDGLELFAEDGTNLETE